MSINFGSITGEKKDDEDICPSLSMQQRVIGWVCCIAFGALLSTLSFVVLFKHQYVEFGILNTLANVFVLSSSLFLAGPKKQAKKMFAETRWIATSVYLLTMIMTFVCALAIKSPGLTIVSVIIQYLAMIWYGLSYIPYARDLVKKMFGC